VPHRGARSASPRPCFSAGVLRISALWYPERSRLQCRKTRFWIGLLVAWLRVSSVCGRARMCVACRTFAQLLGGFGGVRRAEGNPPQESREGARNGNNRVCSVEWKANAHFFRLSWLISGPTDVDAVCNSFHGMRQKLLDSMV